MSELVISLVESRNALVDFAVELMAWHQRPTDTGRERVIDAARVAGATTGIPDVFEGFAARLEQQARQGGSETL